MSETIITLINSTTWEVFIQERRDFTINATVFVTVDELPAPRFPTPHMIAHVARGKVLPVAPKPLKARKPKQRTIPKELTETALEQITQDANNQSEWSRAHEVCHHAAQINGMDVDALASMMTEAYETLSTEFALEIPSKREAHKRVGLTVKQVLALGDNGKDYSSLPHFDEIAQSLSYEFPELGWNAHQTALSEELWALLQSEMPVRPTKYGSSTVERAVELLARRESSDEIEFTEWNPENDVLNVEPEFTLF